jgi:tRNA-uridine 2-sulfurtransferase
MSASLPQNILVGLSGGVDSSVTAWRLRQQHGSERVSCMFMKNWEEEDVYGACPAEEDAAMAADVASALGLKFYARNFATEYWDGVFEYFLAELKRGRTPNPDVLCNREVKFKTFIEHARALGADYIATGHYARKDEVDGRFRLLKGKDNNKDQSYFLHQLDQSQLAPALFPIGDLEKPEVRNLAKLHALPSFAKKDSTGICFIGEKNFTPFLKRYLTPVPGAMKTIDARSIGEHEGLQFYTLGQRGGLHLGGIKGGNGEPWFVIGKRFASNELFVHQGEHPALYATRLRASLPHWIAAGAPNLPLRCMAKTRYRQPDQSCVVTPYSFADGRPGLEVQFQVPQRAITPGQFVVFYQEDECLGGATIEQFDGEFGDWE